MQKLAYRQRKFCTADFDQQFSRVMLFCLSYYWAAGKKNSIEEQLNKLDYQEIQADNGSVSQLPFFRGIPGKKDNFNLFFLQHAFPNPYIHIGDIEGRKYEMEKRGQNVHTLCEA